MNSRADPAVLCDFDGTVACTDVGNSFFRTFARPPWEEVVRAWEEGRLGSKECLERECALTRASFEDLVEFAGRQRVDPHFADLIEWTRSRFIPLSIVSDGFGEYIRLILEGHGLQVPYFANRVEFHDHRLRPVFPYHGLGCSRCANCKGYHVGRFKRAGFRTVFIGDGLSDLCALPESDVVLAKGDLADHCERESIGFTRIRDLGDALRALQKFQSADFAD